MTAAPDQYFATLQGAPYTGELMKRVENYYEYLRTSGRLGLWRRSYDYYYHGLLRKGSIILAGQENEFTTISANHYRNVLQHMMNMTTQQRPAFEPSATNTDYKTMAQVKIANVVLDYYSREKRAGASMENYGDQAIEKVLIYGEADIAGEWDANDGPDYGVDAQQRVVKQGDIRFKTYGPIDVIRDITLDGAGRMTWKILRDFENRYELAARFPEQAQRIMSIPTDTQGSRERAFFFSGYRDTDHIPVYKLYHDKSAAVPQGRYTLFIDTDLPLIDGPLPYRAIPSHRVAASEQDGTPFAYTIGFDLLAIQQAIDSLYSTILTNQTSFGVQNILMPTGANIGTKQLADGLNLITYDPKQGKPEALNLTHTPAEIFNFLQQLEHLMETLSGVNSVARGNPEASLKSGAALALVQSMAIQFNSGLQKCYAQMLEAVGTNVINILKDYAKTKRMISIAGKSNRPYMVEFSGEDLSSVNRVTVNMGNPLSRTTAGKVEMADTLLEHNMIENADQYLQVITTGRLEPLTEGKQAELLLIRSENELLADGKEVHAVVTDNHPLHAIEHKCTLSSPEARNNPEIVKNTIAHLQEHIDQMQALSANNPNLLVMLGLTPLQQPDPAQIPGGAAAPAPAAGAPGHGPSPAPTLNAENPVTLKAGAVNMPQMPKNPLTGDRAAAPAAVGA